MKRAWVVKAQDNPGNFIIPALKASFSVREPEERRAKICATGWEEGGAEWRKAAFTRISAFLRVNLGTRRCLGNHRCEGSMRRNACKHDKYPLRLEFPLAFCNCLTLLYLRDKKGRNVIFNGRTFFAVSLLTMWGSRWSNKPGKG